MWVLYYEQYKMLVKNPYTTKKELKEFVKNYLMFVLCEIL